MTKHFLKSPILGLALVGGLVFVSCKTENETVIKNTLIANAGDDVVERNDTEIPLDGTDSRDLDNKPFNYQWQVIEKPTNASAGIEDDEAAEATFIGNLAGEYLIKLTIYNDNFESSDTVAITLLENSLLADAGYDTTVEMSSETQVAWIQLDGSASEDLEGQEFDIEWTIVSSPAESQTIAVVDDNTLTPTYGLDAAGEYQIKLTISNDFYESIDLVTVTVTAAPQGVILDAPIDADRTLTNIYTDNRPDYIVTTDLSVSATLTLEAGTIVQFETGTLLSIESDGAIIAVGDANNPVVFRGEVEGAGEWRGIKVYSTSSQNRFEHVMVKDAGSNFLIDGVFAGLALIDAKMNIVNTEFTNIDGYGLYVREGSELLEFSENNFNACQEAGLKIDALNVSKLDAASLYSEGNTRSGIEVYTAGLDGSNPHTWKAPSDESAYVILLGLTVDAGWILEPGVILQMASNTYIGINSTAFIQAMGTQEAPVQFTSMPNSGLWRGMVIYSSNETNQFNHTRFVEAGNTAVTSGVKAAVALSGSAKARFANTYFSFNGGYGLFVQDGTEITAFSNNHFNNNALAGLLTDPDNVKQLDVASVFSDNNGVNAVEVSGGSISQGIEATWKGFNDNTPYKIKGDMSVEIGWYIMAGAKFQLGSSVHIAINSGDGFISAIGQSDKKIIFSGFSEQPGAWQGIIIYSNNVMNSLQHVEINYAGGTALLGGIKSNMTLFGSSKASIKNCSFANGAGYGLHISTGAEINADYATINLFSNNTLGEIYTD